MEAPLFPSTGIGVPWRSCATADPAERPRAAATKFRRFGCGIAVPPGMAHAQASWRRSRGAASTGAGPLFNQRACAVVGALCDDAQSPAMRLELLTNKFQQATNVPAGSRRDGPDLGTRVARWGNGTSSVSSSVFFSYDNAPQQVLSAALTTRCGLDTVHQSLFFITFQRGFCSSSSLRSSPTTLAEITKEIAQYNGCALILVHDLVPHLQTASCRCGALASQQALAIPVVTTVRAPGAGLPGSRQREPC
jgi:hypothetical protein